MSTPINQPLALDYLESEYGVPAVIAYPDGTLEPFDGLEHALRHLG